MAINDQGMYQLAGLLSQLPTFSGRPNPTGGLAPALFAMGQQARADAQRKQRQEQVQTLLGQAPKIETMPQAGPMRPGEARPELTAVTQGSGLLGGQMAPAEFYGGLLSVPGMEQVGAQGLLSLQQAQMAAALNPKERKTLQDASGRHRYVDTGELVFSDAQPAPADYKDVSAMRKEYITQAKPFVTVRDAFGKVVESAKKPSAAGDLSLIFNYMKMLDPGSVVREGEFATAQNATGVPTQVRNMYNRAINGERLAPEQRLDFVSQAGSVYDSQLKFYNGLRSEYSRLAQGRNFDPSEVLVDYVGDFNPDLSALTGGANPPPPPPGFTPLR